MEFPSAHSPFPMPPPPAPARRLVSQGYPSRAGWREARRAQVSSWWPSFAAPKVRFPPTLAYACVFFVLTLFVPAALCPNLARAAENSVQIMTDISGAAGQVAGAGANITVLAADVANHVTRGSLNLAAEMWAGVDLLNIQAYVATGHVFARSSEAFSNYLSEHANSTNLTDDQRLFVASVAATVSRDVPAVTRSDSAVANNHSWSAEVEARQLSDGYLCIFWVLVEFNYEVRWANPIWDVFGIDVQREHLRVLESVRGSLKSQVAFHRPSRWMTAEEALLPVHGESLLEASWRWSRAIWREMR